MAMTKNTKTGLAVAGGILGILLLTGAMRKKKQGTFARPGDTVERMMGQMFVVRLPRGEYNMLGGEGFLVNSEADSGIFTDIVLTPETRALAYTAELIFANEDDPSEQHKLTVLVREPLEGMDL